MAGKVSLGLFLLAAAVGLCLVVLDRQVVYTGEVELVSHEAPWISHRGYLRVGRILLTCGTREFQLAAITACHAKSVVSVRYVNCVRKACAHPSTPPPEEEDTGYYAYKHRPEFSGDFKHPYDSPSYTPPAPGEDLREWSSRPIQVCIFSSLLTLSDAWQAEENRRNTIANSMDGVDESPLHDMVAQEEKAADREVTLSEKGGKKFLEEQDKGVSRKPKTVEQVWDQALRECGQPRTPTKTPKQYCKCMKQKSRVGN